MNEVEIAMSILVVTASAFVGVIAAMVGVIQGVLNQLEYPSYIRVMKGIIVTGRKSPVVWGLLLIPVAAAAFVLFALRDEMDTPTFVWTGIGTILFIAGPVLVSRFGNEPWYDSIMLWQPGTPPVDWELRRMVWFRLNIARFTIGALACLAFAAALANYH
ncbi:MAG: hypothetical protein K8L99_33335 [Anaerolineae bacterium]|nr:hypothetical protein [Anaerolineae bacterium]